MKTVISQICGILIMGLVTTWHVTKQSFVTNNVLQGFLKFGDGWKVRIEVIGSIKFQCKNGEQRVFLEVYYIPRLCNDIISLGQLVEKGDQIWMQCLFLWIHDEKGRSLMKVKRSQNRLYKIMLNQVDAKCLLGKTSDQTWRWH